MRIILPIICLLLPLQVGTAQTAIRDLPGGALVVETRKLISPKHRKRMLVLWMLNPRKNPTGYAPDDIYTCPDQSRGSHYSGKTRVSLVDTATARIINTEKISEAFADDNDSFDVPYAIRKGYYYQVNRAVRPGIEAKPTIMRLKDYNGDGKALEFALFEAEACMGLGTTLIGYSEKRDRVIQYPIQLDVIEGSRHSERHDLWADYLFSQKPQRPGYWKYEIDYRGRAGSLDKWEVWYNATAERFEGTLTIVPGDM